MINSFYILYLLLAVALVVVPCVLFIFAKKRAIYSEKLKNHPENLSDALTREEQKDSNKKKSPHQDTVILQTTNFAPEIGTKIGNFKITGEISSGGMGKIMKGVSDNGIVAAVKIMKPEHCTDENLVERFQQELRIVSMLNHENIAKILEWGIDGDRNYFAMEYVKGESLRDILEEQTISISKTLAITKQLCSALEYAHSKKVVHRDIKPENILIDSIGKVKLVDFGIARIIDNRSQRLTLTNVAMGSPLYMSPEQKNDFRHVDHRADIYSLGVVLYEMLSGEMPGGLMRLDLIPQGLRHIIEKSTAYRPDERYTSVGAMKTELENYERFGTLGQDQHALDEIGENIRLRNAMMEVLYQNNAPSIPGVSLDFFYMPAGGVGGNYYEFVRIEGDKLGILVGNIFDKPDVKSALFLTMLRSLFHIASENETSPATTLRKLNRMMARESRSVVDRFAVLSYIVYDTAAKVLSVATAGYRPVCVLQKSENTLKAVSGHGFGIGISEDSEFEEQKVQLASGDIVVLSSAGIAETKNLDGSLYGELRLEEAILKNRNSAPSEIINAIQKEIAIFGAGVAQQDDITLVVFKVE